MNMKPLETMRLTLFRHAKCARTIYRSNSIMAAIHPKRKVRGVLPAQRPIFDKSWFLMLILTCRL
jgi:hypothetical protein